MSDRISKGTRPQGDIDRKVERLGSGPRTCSCLPVFAGYPPRPIGFELDPACQIHAPTCGFCSGSGTVQQLRLDGSEDAPRPCGQCGAWAKQRRRGRPEPSDDGDNDTD